MNESIIYFKLIAIKHQTLKLSENNTGYKICTQL